MSSQTFPPQTVTRSTFGTNARVITEGSASALTPPAKAVVLLTAGNITITPDADGAPDLTFVGVPAGFIPPYAVRRVVALGSGATCATVDE
jgi:hypothetical protein